MTVVATSSSCLWGILRFMNVVVSLQPNSIHTTNESPVGALRSCYSCVYHSKWLCSSNKLQGLEKGACMILILSVHMICPWKEKHVLWEVMKLVGGGQCRLRRLKSSCTWTHASRKWLWSLIRQSKGQLICLSFCYQCPALNGRIGIWECWDRLISCFLVLFLEKAPFYMHIGKGLSGVLVLMSQPKDFDTGQVSPGNLAHCPSESHV